MTTEEPPGRASPPIRKTSLAPRQAWFLGVAAASVVAMFGFVIVPYIDREPARLAGQQIPDFNLEVIGGEPGARLSLSSLRGKPVVIDFWASWCQPCREQSGALSRLTQQMGDKVQFVGIATSDQREDAIAFVKGEKPLYLNVFDEGGNLGRSLHVTALPTLLVLDQNGTVRSLSSRTFTEAELQAHIADALR